MLFLCHWALVGFSKVYFFGIPEDLLLASALVPALYLFFKEYIDVNFRRNAKPDLRVMNMLLAGDVFRTRRLFRRDHLAAARRNGRIDAGRPNVFSGPGIKKSLLW